MRIGQGIDAHAWCAGDGITLGGVRIPHKKSIAAHSDGDVLVHALCDALLGASCLGDLGSYFAEATVPRACDSRLLLRQLFQEMRRAGWQFVQMDSTVIAQQPRLRPFIRKMRQNIASDLQCAANRVSVKATTTDGLGFTGREEGIAATAVVLLQEPD